MNRKSQKFKALEQEWYGKLKDSGFEDIERGSGSQDHPLNSTSTSLSTSRLRKKSNSHGGFYFKEEYYRRAGHFLHDYAFESEYDHKIWSLHSSGLSLRKIVDLLKLEGIKTSTMPLQRLVSQLKLEMKRMYVDKK